MSTYCVLPWTHLANEAQGALRACCIAQDTITGPDGKPMLLQENSVSDIFYSDYMKNLRQVFRDGGKPKTCSICWSDEANGKQSKRMIYTKIAKDHGKTINFAVEPPLPDDYQLILNNTCNLKCRTCHPNVSSKWTKEAKDRGIKYDKMGSNRIIDDESVFWNTRDEWMPGVRSLEFMGGEPFFMREFETVIDEFIARGHASDIHIRMSSNCTQRPERLIGKISERFKSFSIGLSLDGIGNRFEYLRNPGKWTVAEANLRYFYDLVDQINDEVKMSVSVTHTVSLHNVYYLHEFNTYMHETFGRRSIWHNLVYFPPWYQISILPRSAKDAICNHLESQSWQPHTWADVEPMLSHMRTTEFDEILMRRAVEEINGGDAYRHENFSDTFPEMYKLIEGFWS